MFKFVVFLVLVIFAAINNVASAESSTDNIFDNDSDFMRGFENMYHKINLQNATPTMAMNSKALKQF